MNDYWRKRRVVNETWTEILYNLILFARFVLVSFGCAFAACIWFALLIWNPVQVIRGEYEINPIMVIAWIITALFTVWYVLRRIR